jgi:mRNA interferase MazF
MLLPDAGDIAWVEFDLVLGTEQAGRRPGLVLTTRSYHENSRRAVVCPITSNARPWPFNVSLPKGLRTKGVVLVDQVRAIDRTQRMFATIESAPGELIAEVRAKLAALLGIDLAPIARGPEGM